MKRIKLIIIAAIISISANAQQFSLYSQYMHNKYALNPAVAGSQEGLTMGASYRQMWTGFKDAPSIKTLYGHTAINETMGVGGKVFSLTTGPTSQSGFEGTYAYHLKIGDDLKLGLGLSAVLTQYSINKSLIDLKNPDDNVMSTGGESLIVPDANFGAYLYSKNYYVGLVAAQLIPLKANFKSDFLENKQERHYFLHGGYNYEINDNLSIEPSILFRYIEAGALQLDANLKFTIKQMFWIGGSYRLNDAAVAMVGVKAGNILFGYSYDYTLSDIGNYSNGSHELVLILKLGGGDNKSLL